jgi:hypothetical protein
MINTMILESFALGALVGYVMPIPTFILLVVLIVLKYKVNTLSFEQLKKQIQGLTWVGILTQIQNLTKGDTGENFGFAMPPAQNVV